MKKMNMLLVFAGIALISLSQNSLNAVLADNVNPITGLVEENRSCQAKRPDGSCSLWKVLVDGHWMLEMSCKATATEPCTVTLKRHDNSMTCEQPAGSTTPCVVRVPW